MEHDFSLMSGERQVGRSLSEIRKDHLLRYEMALQFLRDKPHAMGLDCFCGNGYGSYWLGKELDESCITGIDASAEAVTFANQYYQLPNVFFSNKLFPFDLPKGIFDFVVSFESIEHVDDGVRMFDELIGSLKAGGYFLFSVPNERINSREKNHHPFHKHHYVDDEVKRILEKRVDILHQYGQNVYVFHDGLQGELLPESDMILRENVEGQIWIYVCRKPKKLRWKPW